MNDIKEIQQRLIVIRDAMDDAIGDGCERDWVARTKPRLDELIIDITLIEDAIIENDERKR